MLRSLFRKLIAIMETRASIKFEKLAVRMSFVETKSTSPPDIVSALRASIFAASM